jgi:hypothetical protein
MKSPQEIAKRPLESADEQRRIATNTKRAITVLRGIAAYEILDAAESESMYRCIGLLEEMTTRLKKSVEIKKAAEKQRAERHTAILVHMKAGPLGSLTPSERIAYIARHSAGYLSTLKQPSRETVKRLLTQDFDEALSDEAHQLARTSELAPQLAAAHAASQFQEQQPQLMRAAQAHIEAMGPHLA